MNIIYLIIGLPGSGKTTLMEKFKRVLIIDDITDIKELPTSAPKRMAISDPYFCREKNLKLAVQTLADKYPEHTIKTIEFENNKEKALKNAKNRKNKKVNNFIASLSNNYQTKNKHQLTIKN